MSRIGKKPILIPDKVKAAVEDGKVKVTGPVGALEMAIAPRVSVSIEGGVISVKKNDETRESDMQQGMMRSIISSMVEGVLSGYSKSLDLVGVGYKAEMQGRDLVLSVGHSHPFIFRVPEGITVKVEKQTRIVVSGADRQKVGETAAQIRKVRPPEPYKGKGIRYADEVVRRKVGKAAGVGGGVRG